MFVKRVILACVPALVPALWGACRVKTLIWRVPLDVVSAAAAPRALKLQAEIK